MFSGYGARYGEIMSFAAERGLRVLEMHASAGITPSDLLEICDAAPTGELIYAGRNTIWALDWRGKSLAVKAFGIPWGIRKWIYGGFRASKAKRSFENASTLITLGLHTPRPLGYAELGSQLCLLKSFYVSEHLSASTGVFPLRDVLLDPYRADREDVLTAFGRYTCTLHDLGVLHRDYSPGNILVVTSDDPGQYRFELIDLNRMSFGALSLQQRMHNLRLLWADDEDLQAVVMGYAEVFGQTTNTLLEAALRASQTHKAKASREERLKSSLRARFGKRSPTGGAT
jgi:tRNA A-37 threonylcarbamoyl transferase component Bud32